MKEFKTNIIVGTLFFVALAIVGYYTILLKDEFFQSKEFYYVSAEFPFGNGLKKNDPVKVLGVYSGTVKSVSLSDGKVIVSMEMFNKFRLYENYSIKIKSDGVMGAKCIDFRPGTSSDEEKTYNEIAINDTVLIGKPSGDLFGAIEDLLADNKNALNDSIQNLRDITVTFKSFSENINVISENIRDGKGTLGKLISDDKIANQTSELLSGLKDSTEDMREQAPITSFLRAALLAF